MTCRTPGTLRGPCVVDVRDLAAEHRTARERGDLHARRPRVDAIDGFAVDLVGRVEPFQRLADELEIRRRLQRRILAAASCPRRRPARARHRRAFRAARIVKDLAVLGAAGCRIDAPLRRRRRDQHGPGGRAGHCASASRRRGRKWSRRSPGSRTAGSRRACRSAAPPPRNLIEGASSSSARIMERAV